MGEIYILSYSLSNKHIKPKQPAIIINQAIKPSINAKDSNRIKIFKSAIWDTQKGFKTPKSSSEQFLTKLDIICWVFRILWHFEYFAIFLTLLLLAGVALFIIYTFFAMLNIFSLTLFII